MNSQKKLMYEKRLRERLQENVRFTFGVGIKIPDDLVVRASWLKRHKSGLKLCNHGLSHFEKIFPDGMPLTRKGLVSLAKHSLPLFADFCRRIGFREKYFDAIDSIRSWETSTRTLFDTSDHSYARWTRIRSGKIADYIADHLGML